MGAYSCSKKKIFYTEEEAQQAADQAMEKYRSMQYFYRCPVCGFFHLTRIDPANYERVKREKRRLAVRGQLPSARKERAYERSPRAAAAYPLRLSWEWTEFSLEV